MNRRTLALMIITVTGLTAVTLLMLGCQKQSGPVGTGPAAGDLTSKQDHLSLAMDYLSRLEEFDPERGMLQTAYHLNRWIEDLDEEDLDEEVPWQADPMIARLPPDLRGIGPLQEIPKREFTTEDILFLREASWMHSVSEWVLQQKTDLGLERWLAQVEESRGEPHAYELAVALRLFDWTVRNIQLDELLPYPTTSAEPSTNGKGETTIAISPLLQAVDGPGYTTFPWQTLMFGHGDAWQRARVFIQLARQRKIDVVMLALEDADKSPRPYPWLPAALIDDQLYLFDAELGLAIPGPNGLGIATLEQVRKDKGLLSVLDVGSQHPYAPAKANLDRVVALLDACPESLSRRMKLVDSLATTGQQLVLSVNPSSLAKRLRQCDGITDVELWRTPFEAWIYRRALGRRAPQDPELIGRLMLEEWIFDGLTPLVQGRQLHFRGKFENQGQKLGAKAHYFAARVPDVDIDRIGTSLEIQGRMGLVRDRENDQQWQAKLQAQKMVVTRVKRNASYWLGLIHYETGRYEAAQEWLKVHTLEAAEDGPWTPGARYNLSRLHEVMGELGKARALLLLDDSAQKHGNLLRARLLREKLEAQGRDPADQD